MKATCLIFGAVAITALTGCASTRIAQTIGPCSTHQEVAPPNGQLRVFSLKEQQTEGFGEGANSSWYQHSAYRIYTPQGKRVKYVGNTVGHYDDAPATITLLAGNYLVLARAEGYPTLLITVPVVVEPGRTTSVHLEGGWTPTAGSPGTKIVRAPGGYAVGWLANISPNSQVKGNAP